MIYARPRPNASNMKILKCDATWWWCLLKIETGIYDIVQHVRQRYNGLCAEIARSTENKYIRMESSARSRTNKNRINYVTRTDTVVGDVFDDDRRSAREYLMR